MRVLGKELLLNLSCPLCLRESAALLPQNHMPSEEDLKESLGEHGQLHVQQLLDLCLKEQKYIVGWDLTVCWISRLWWGIQKIIIVV